MYQISILVNYAYPADHLYAYLRYRVKRTESRLCQYVFLVSYQFVKIKEY